MARPAHIEDILVGLHSGQWFGWSDSSNRVYANLQIYAVGGVTHATPSETSLTSALTAEQAVFDGSEVTTAVTESVTNAGSTVAVGSVCYMAADGELTLANSGSATTAPVIAMATEAGTDGTPNAWTYQGFVRNDAWSWTVGSLLYLTTSSGGMTHTKPTTVGEYVQELGVATHTNRIWFSPIDGAVIPAPPVVVPPDLYAFTDATFSPGGAVNKTGPTLSQARTGLTGTGVSVWKNDTLYFNTSGGIQLWTVPADGDYRIETWGASGGGYGSAIGGYGSRMRGDFTLTSGDVIKILVGQTGGASYGGGGGMTAVATNTNTPLIVSGGGNTTSAWHSTRSHATTNTTGVNGSSGMAGGSGGAGGNSSAGSFGGAGFTGNPTGGDSCSATRPLSFTNGGTGGYSCNAIGGFGGGSASDGCCYGASGAGGGYGGGGGTSSSSQYGGGGGSYNNGANQSNSNGNTSGAQLSGNGVCTITKLP